MTRHSILLGFSALLCSLSLHAQSIHWSLPPVYIAAEPLSAQWIRVSDGSGWGIVSADGEVVQASVYDRITDFQEGYSLLLKGDKLMGLFSMDGDFRTFQDLYVDLSYPYFSEGLLAVRDVSSSWTYMTPDGKFPIRMVFQYAAPFSHGLAAVREKNGEGSYLHIDKKGNVSLLASDYPDNYLIFASSFTNLNGQAGALVVDGHSQVSLRSLNGGKLLDFGKMRGFDRETQVLTTREYEIALSEGRFIQSRKRLADGDVKQYATAHDRAYQANVPAFSFPKQGGLFGVSLRGEVLLEPQLEGAQALSERCILTRQGGKFGLLAVTEEEAPSLTLDKHALVVRHPSDLLVSAHWIVPPSIPFKDARVKLREADGMSRELILDNTSFSFPVVHLIKDQPLHLQLTLSADGLTYPPVDVTIPVEYCNGFTVAVPSQVTLQPGNEKAVLSIQITNEADVPASAFEILVDGRVVMTLDTLEVQGHTSIPLSFPVSLEDLDSVSREFQLEIREKDVPACTSRHRVVFNRNFN